MKGLHRLPIFLRDRINGHTLLILTSALIGVFAGFTGVALKKFVRFLHDVVHWMNESSGNYMFFLFPLLGILAAVAYIQFFHYGKLTRGVAGVLDSIANRNGNVRKQNLYGHVFSSALTVGFGGSAGLEGPIVVTGSAIGSNTGGFLGFTGADKKVLLAAGAAAGTAAVFNAPIAGVIFAIEVLLPGITISSFIPLLVAAASASVVSNILFFDVVFFQITKSWEVHAIPFYVMLGIFCGLISIYITRTNIFVEGLFQKSQSVYGKAITGGLLLGLLIFLIPPLYGEGYITINALLTGDNEKIVEQSLFSDRANDPWFLLMLAGGMIFIKVIATSITVGSGGNGGIFAPSLFMGATAGYTFARFFELTGIQKLLIPNFTVAGMAGILSGVIYAPLTAIFLIAEITGGYALFIPLMIVSALSFFIARFFDPVSIYHKALEEKERGKKSLEEKILRNVTVNDLLETDFASVPENASFSELLTIISGSKRNVFPVVDDTNEFEGVILLDDIRSCMFDGELHQKPVTDFLSAPGAMLTPEMTADQVLKIIDHENSWNLPVIDKNGKYLGFVSKSKVLQTFRENLNGSDKSQ